MNLKNSTEIDLPPHAASLIEGLRDFGYSLETSLADIVDNSITARANRIDILADTITDDPWVAIADNGTGMTRTELLEALRPGSKNPRHEREAKDLGRFGLGLKSASFSQCRQLTVLTRKDGSTTAAAWDLDRVSETNRWSAVILDDPSKVPAAEHLGESGTIVIWKKLDRLDGGYKHDRAKRTQTLNSALSSAERHLRLVFHRYLSGSPARISIYLNRLPLHPIDPFAEGHPARQLENLAREFEERNGISMSLGAVVTSDDFEPWLDQAKQHIDPFYWKRYREHLVNTGLPREVVIKLDDITDNTLGRMGNPRQEKPFDTRGMVVGHVQSGKTSNYTGLICKAADAGFEVAWEDDDIIVSNPHDDEDWPDVLAIVSKLLDVVILEQVMRPPSLEVSHTVLSYNDGDHARYGELL